MLPLAKRLASAVICLAVVWGATPSVRGDLSARRGPNALTFDRLAGATEIGTGGVAPRLFASGRKLPFHHHELATAEARAGIPSGGAWTRVVRRATVVDAFLAVCARAERGPPNTTLS